MSHRRHRSEGSSNAATSLGLRSSSHRSTVNHDDNDDNTQGDDDVMSYHREGQSAHSQQHEQHHHHHHLLEQQQASGYLPFDFSFVEDQYRDDQEALQMLAAFQREDTITVVRDNLQLDPADSSAVVSIITALSCACCGPDDSRGYIFWTRQEAASSSFSVIAPSTTTFGRRPDKFLDIVAAARDHCASAKHHKMLRVMHGERYARLRQLVPVPATNKGTFSRHAPLVDGTPAGSDARDPHQPQQYETVPRYRVNINGYDFICTDAPHGSEAFETTEQRRLRLGVRELAPRHAASSAERHEEQVDDESGISNNNGDANDEDEKRILSSRFRRAADSGDGGAGGDQQHPFTSFMQEEHGRHPRLYSLARLLSSGQEGLCTTGTPVDVHDVSSSTAGQQHQQPQKRGRGRPPAAAAAQRADHQSSSNDVGGGTASSSSGRNYTLPRSRGRDLRVIVTDAKQRMQQFFSRYRRLVVHKQQLLAETGMTLQQARREAWIEVCAAVKETVVADEHKSEDCDDDVAQRRRERRGTQVEPGDVFRVFLNTREANNNGILDAASRRGKKKQE